MMFATSPGTTALDGAGENGLFTMHLLEALKQPLTLHEAFMHVVREVSKTTGDRQRPQTLQDLIVEFSFYDVGDQFEPPDHCAAEKALDQKVMRRAKGAFRPFR